MSLSTLMRYAFDAPVNSGGISDADPIRGGPAWVYSELYTIEAKTDDAAFNGPTSLATQPGKLLMGPMLRTVLVDRFQLKTHQEIEEVPMYALIVSKSGLKIKPIGKDGCTPRDQRDAARSLLANSTGKRPVCGSIYVAPDGPNLRLAYADAPLSRLSDILTAFVMDRHVIDKTGVHGIFNVDITFARDGNTPAQVNPLGDDGAPDVPPGPSIFTVLEQQLGLRLEKIGGPRDYIVIDSVQRPSEN